MLLTKIRMDRLEWSDTNLVPGEEQVNLQPGIAVYDGQDKVTASFYPNINIRCDILAF